MNAPYSEQETQQEKAARYLIEEFQFFIEDNYYAKSAQQATLEYVVQDDAFLNNPTYHIGLYSDHGVPHVRNVAEQILRVLSIASGVLIPARNASRSEFMRAYGVQVAYLHDIGMSDFSDFGRAVHPQFAAQLIYTEHFTDILDALWNENCGNLAWRLTRLDEQQLLEQPPKQVLQELLALSMCHSKSAVSIDILNDPARLRKAMQDSIRKPLRLQYLEKILTKTELALASARQEQDEQKIDTLTRDIEHARREHQRSLASSQDSTLDNRDLARHYNNFTHDSFAWLVSPLQPVYEMAVDVIDTLRALRCADALRQRGTALKTSAGYEVYIDPINADAIYALRNAENTRLYLLETSHPVGAGEANMAGSQLNKKGNLWISFHRGSFGEPHYILKAAQNAAILIDDIYRDAVVSFRRSKAWDRASGLPPPQKTDRDIEIIIEGVEDNPEFTHLVCEALARINPDTARRCKPVPSLAGADIDEFNRYIDGSDPDWNEEQQQYVLNKIAATGQKTAHMDGAEAFVDTKLVTANAGKTIMTAGTPSNFVYIPLDNGLQVFPLGGYDPAYVKAWVPTGNTGVIRGSTRNANVVVEKNTQLLMIPKQVYLRYWYAPYAPRELSSVLIGSTPPVPSNHLNIEETVDGRQSGS